MSSVTPRYKKDAATEDMPRPAELPTLKICQIGEGNKLILPRDVRSQFLQDPVWGQEWRDIVTNFDKQWNTPVLENPSPAGASNSPTPSPSLVAKKEEHLDAEFDWGSVFQGEPETLDALKAKYSDRTEMTGSASYNFILVPGPKLFVVATDALHLKATDSAIISHGAGVWLLGEKAEKYQTDHPGRGVICSWTDDLGLVVLEDQGSKKNFIVFKKNQEDQGSKKIFIVFKKIMNHLWQDGASDSGIMTLRTALQTIETQGMVDYTLGGHSCARPAAVSQGREDDKFSIAPDGGNLLLWRPNQIPMKNLKAANVASHFNYDNLKASPLKLAPRINKWKMFT